MTLLSLILFAVFFGAMSGIPKHLLGWENGKGFKGLCLEVCYVVLISLSVMLWGDVFKEVKNYTITHASATIVEKE